MTRFTGFRLSLARRGVATTLVAALAMSACGVTGGETTITASEATPVEVTAVPTSAPVFAPPTPAPTPTPTPYVLPAGADATPQRGARSDATDTEATAPAPTPVPTATATPTTEAPTTAPPSTDSEPAEGTPTEEAPTETEAFNQVNAADCMDGVWASQPGQVGAYMERLSELTGASMSASGSVTVALENGRYVYDTFITTSIDVDGFQTWSVLEGITQGDFTYTNGFIVAEQTFAEIDAYVELPDGTQLDAGGGIAFCSNHRRKAFATFSVRGCHCRNGTTHRCIVWSKCFVPSAVSRRNGRRRKDPGGPALGNP